MIRLVTDEKIWDKPIVTRLEPFKNFYEAEEYHRDYYKRNSQQPYCQLIIAPKIEKLQKLYLDKLKPKFQL